METCTGCRRAIDPTFDSHVRDNYSRPWHTACMARARGARSGENRPRGVGGVWGWVVVTALFPVAGFIAGIVFLFRDRVGPGFGLIILSLALFGTYAALLS